MSKISDNQYLALQPHCILRNDETYGLLYTWSSPSETNQIILAPMTCAIVSFLNGQFPVVELLSVLKQVFNFDSVDTTRDQLEEIVTGLNKRSDMIAILDEPASWEVGYNPKDFMIKSLDSFEAPQRFTRPISLTVHPTGACHTNCRYCYIDLKRLRKCKDQPISWWANIFDQAIENEIFTIGLAGGDPMARTDSVEFLRLLCERDIATFVSTKCHISKEVAKSVMEVGYTKPRGKMKRIFQLSIDTADEDIAKHFTGVSGYVERVKSSARNLLEVGIYPRIKGVISQINLSGMRDLVATFAEIGVDDFVLSPYEPSFFRGEAEMINSSETPKTAVDIIKDIKDEFPDVVISSGFYGRGEPSEVKATNSKLDPVDKFLANRPSCRAGRESLGVTPDGKVFICEQIVMKEPFIVGDLKKQSIMDIWNSKEIKDLIYPTRERYNGNACNECSLFEECIHKKGHCFRDNYFNYNDDIYQPMKECPLAVGR